MSEKMYTRLLRLYPARFRKKYEGEALQLIRDRLRDETGFFKRARLGWDLVADVLAGLPQAYRNSYAVTEEAPASPNAGGIPSFKVLDKEPLGRGSILIGGTLSLGTIVAFGFLLSRPIAYMPLPGSNGRMSPIESVVERLNRAATPDTTAGGAEDATESTSVGASQRQPRPSPAESTSKPDAPALPSKSTNGIDKRDQIVSIEAQNAFPESTKRDDSGTRGNVLANGVTANVPSTSHAGNPVKEHAQSLIPLEQPRLQNASIAMIRLFDRHDVVMFGEAHDSEQEYRWLCKLVKTPGFSDQVDDIVVEFGNALYQKTVDRYVAGEDVPFDEVQEASRNMVGDVLPVSPEYGWLYKAVREANMEHPGKRGIRLVMGSPPVDWDKIKSSADLAPYESEREQWYARVVKTEVLAKHHHALLIMGAGHFLRGHEEALQYELAAEQHRDLPRLDRIKLHLGYIEREIRAAGADPYLVVFGTNAVDNHGDVDRRFDSLPAPALVPLFGNWVGSLPAQPVISGGHAPAIPLTLADQADALLYVAPCSALRTLYLSPADLDGTAYGQEMTRRDIIEVGHPLTFPYGALPQCVQPKQSSR
jgi:hypothetical protein